MSNQAAELTAKNEGSRDGNTGNRKTPNVEPLESGPPTLNRLRRTSKENTGETAALQRRSLSLADLYLTPLWTGGSPPLHLEPTA
ncbi:Hypothetical predicted protein [Pelobates cultripes]|uniref:Uncharacterized protein n=1 Tax=Pelobates cultripes TaxID=61616 RepID=A0AAD1RAR2_PELCU|nr:Hypothetical predicted protein [Pelobates cultripes]